MRDMTRWFLLTAATLILTVASTGPASAAKVIDQQFGPPPGNVASVISSASPFGQSFTPTLAGIDFAIFELTDFNGDPGVAGTYEVEVHVGINGALLGTSNPLALPGGFGAPGNIPEGAPAEFDFASTVTLTPGLTHSLILVRTDASSRQAAIGNSPGSYAGGQAIGTLFGSAEDLLFQEGINVADVAVPEPATLVLSTVGVLMAVAYRGRRRRIAA